MQRAERVHLLRTRHRLALHRSRIFCVADADEFELAELAALRVELEAAIVTAVHGQRAIGRSWAYIGAALGMRRQSAQERYGEKAAS